MYDGYGSYNSYGSYGGYGNINPMQPQIDRLIQMQQMQQAQQQPPQPQQPTGQQVILVGGIEEVKAHQVDWSGKPNYFVDNANDKIYIKRLSMEGIPVISTYSLDNTPSENKDTYCTKEELNSLKSELDNYKNVLDNLLSQLGGNKNE